MSLRGCKTETGGGRVLRLKPSRDQLYKLPHECSPMPPVHSELSKSMSRHVGSCVHVVQTGEGGGVAERQGAKMEGLGGNDK